jgi:signal transduction histidine kinase
MSPAWRRGLFALVLAALWATPSVLPFGEGLDRSFTLGWYIAFTVGALWPAVVAWAFFGEISRLESGRPAAVRAAALLAVGAGLGALAVDRVVWPFLCITCEPLMHPPTAILVHHLLMVQGGIALALSALGLLVSGAAGRPIRAADPPLRWWVATIALVLFVTPPYVLHAKAGQVLVFVVALGLGLLRDLPALEEKVRWGRVRVRAAVLVIGVVAWVVPIGEMPDTGWRLFGMNALASFKLAGIETAFVVLCMTAGDLLAWAMRHSKSVRARMLVLGLCCAALALLVAGQNIRFDNPEPSAAVFNLPLKVVVLGVATYAFASALSRRLSRSLEQSAWAISEIRRGNLDVSLDASGRDEVAAVAKTFNEMVSMLREAEFLEQINSDLQSRSRQLTDALEALRAAQTDLVRAERMASVATLVKGIAHELNNPINYIAGNIAPLMRYCSFLTGVATQLADGRARDRDELSNVTRLSPGKDLAFVTGDLTRLTADIAEGARRAQLIITDLQSLTSAAQRRIERVDLHRLVRQTVSLMSARLSPALRIETDLLPTPEIPARAGQLEQVLVNLTDNALRATGGKGVVRIRVAVEEDQVVVKVIDDGAGMSPEVMRQAFEPFFTTRSAGEGSGLGLAIVASIVRGHSGTVKLSSEIGQGTEVEVRLPVKTDLLTDAELAPIRARA